jgi:RNA polymerase sigma factor (sigma-70 family)
MMNRIKDVGPIASPSRIADGDLLARFLTRRDDAAFAELVERHGRMVFGVCRRRLGQAADAEDAFQAVFLSLAKHAEGLASRTTVGPWLYLVARQLTTKALRRRSRRRWLPWNLAPEPKTAEPPEVDVDLDAALASLSEPERAAIVLCHLEGLSRSEAAKALGCPEGTLSARLSRGLEKLRKRLGKPPLAALVAASLVLLPDRLPASTVDLVHHFRDGALDDWASAGTLDLFRKADPMRYLDRAGPVVASIMALGLIAVGASFGLNLLQAQQEKKPDEKANVADDRPRGGLGGDAALGGGGSSGGMMMGMGGGLGDSRPRGEGGVWLADAVKEFNQWALSTSIGGKQPPLTEDEVIAAIVAWTRDPGAPTAGDLFDAFHRVAETRKLPSAWSLDAVDSWKTNEREIEGWRIQLRLSLAPNKSYAHVIRDQKIRVRPDVKSEYAVHASNAALITLPLKNSNAESVAELLRNAIGGKWLDTKVVADSRTNTVLVYAPEVKREAILKMLNAIDELHK